MEKFTPPAATAKRPHHDIPTKFVAAHTMVTGLGRQVDLAIGAK